MTEPTKEMTLDDAANAVGQMENFFKAFRRVSEVVQFMREAEQRKKELAAEVETLDAAREAALAAAKDQREDADGEFKVLTKKLGKAREALEHLRAEAERETAEAEVKVADIRAAGEASRIAAEEAVDAVLVRKAGAEAEAAAAEARLDDARKTLAAMVEAGN